jgi:hypothetical protein
MPSHIQPTTVYLGGESWRRFNENLCVEMAKPWRSEFANQNLWRPGTPRGFREAVVTDAIFAATR